MTSKKQDAKKLIILLDSKYIVEVFTDTFLEKAIPYDDLRNKMRSIFFAEENVKDLTSLIVSIYLDNFTHKELKEIIKFYESDVGKKLIKKNPELIQLVSESGKKWAEALVLKFSDEIVEVAAEHSQRALEDKCSESIDEKLFSNSYGFGGLTSVGKKTMEEIHEDISRSKRIFDKRYKFACDYSKEKGWDPNNLTEEQIIEIRSRDEWNDFEDE